MKSIIMVFFSIALFASCNSGGKSEKQTDTSKMNTDTSKSTTGDATSMAEVTPSFNDVNPTLAASLKTVIDHYLHIKNALINSDGKDAASGGKQMADAISKVDKSLFTSDQKKIYDGIEDDLKENAEHISESASDIDHQREHFSMMSEDVYDLAKAFGGGQTLYHDHCPMANDNKGAMWLSEMKEVKNPYFGGKMNECVKVQEVIK